WQFDRDPPVAPGREQPVRDEPHGGRFAILRAVHEVGDHLLGPLVEQRLGREGFLVQRAGRPAGRVAALTRLETHGLLLWCYRRKAIKSRRISDVKHKKGTYDYGPGRHPSTGAPNGRRRPEVLPPRPVSGAIRRYVTILGFAYIRPPLM